MQTLKDAINKYKNPESFYAERLSALLAQFEEELARLQIAKAELTSVEKDKIKAELLTELSVQVQSSTGEVNVKMLTKIVEGMFSNLKGDKGDIPTEEVKQMVRDSMPSDEHLLGLIKPLIPIVQDGKIPSDKELLKLIRPLIPEIPEITDKKLLVLIKPLIPPAKDGSPDKPLEIAAKLNTLTEEVDLKVIRGLTTYLANLQNTFREKTRQGGGGDSYQNYDLSSQLNGVTKSFTIPASRKVWPVIGSSAPSIFRPTIDYTYTRTSITFTASVDATSALASGQSLMLFYTR